MAFTKEEKVEIVNIYESWFDKSEAVYILSYKNMSMKTIDEVRAKIRDLGGEIHVIKNTLFKRVLDKKDLSYPQDFMLGSNMAAFAFTEPPSLAKLLNDTIRSSDSFEIKGGYLGKQSLTIDEVKALAELPPLPVVRAMLLGTLQAPASQLVRTIAEPARSLASVFRAYSEKEEESAVAA